MTIEATTQEVLRDVEQAETYVAGICFKTGPPRLTGVELEWTVHDVFDPACPLNRDALARALHPHAPSTLDPLTPGLPLPSGSCLTVEPGGQVEISALPQPSLSALQYTVTRDIDYLTSLLSQAGLRLGERAIDPHRSPHQILSTARYDAMARAFRRYNHHGQTMMCATAGLQVCVDAGRERDFAARWEALHECGPALVALFANSSRYAGHDTGWASARMAAWLGMDPHRTAPVARGGDPLADWVAYALAAPVLIIRQPDGPWRAPVGVTFRDWVNGAITPRPTRDDLAYHLTTLFPPVRPRGYLEVRYLDTQPRDEWIAPVAVVSALLAPDVLDAARDICAPTAGRWRDAARLGLTDVEVAASARGLAELALHRLEATGLSPQDRADINAIIDRRLATTANRSAPAAPSPADATASPDAIAERERSI